MTLLSLIFGDKVKTQGKVVPAAEFSKLIEAQELLDRVKDEAERYREQVAAEGEKLKEEAEKAGFESGMEKWSAQVAHLEKEIAGLREEYRKVIVPVAVKAARRIVGRELETNPDTIADIVATSLQTVAQHKRIVIYCNRADLEALEGQRDKLKEVFENLESLSIQEREDVEENGCIIETEAGIINAQAERQWKALEDALDQIADRF
jgi:type III secretion protein L